MTANSTFAAFCPGCFADKGGASICQHCGYNESLKRGPLVLAHRTLLNHGQYLIGRVLGKPGGFGITYLALDTKLETRVAIKEYLPRDLAGRDASHATVAAHSNEDEEFFRYGLTQFLQEARTLAQFDHANIVRVRNFFEENGTGYLVMDYYDGVTLADYLALQPQGKLPEKTAVAILMPILDGLREVHAKNFLHRDIKPQNIYLTTGNRPILLDFGAARQAMGERSRSLSVVLSEGYAPYEQYHRRGEQGPWTDIYACAAVLYHAVAGEAPPPATERVHKDELDIAALGLSASLTNALRLGLAVDHHNRPQRMTEFQALLLGDKEPILTSAITPPPKASLRSSEEGSAPEVAPVSTKQTQNQSTSSLAKWAILAALIVGVVITIMIVDVGEQKKVAPSPDVATPTTVPPAPTIAAAPIEAPEDPDTTLWNEAKASGERNRLDAYLKQYPKGKFVELAEIELKKLDERASAENDRLEAEKKQAAEQLKADQLLAEQQVWDQAKADNTPNAYAAYLNSYPKGRFSSLALKAQQIAHEEAAKRERQAADETARREQEAKNIAAEAIRREQEAKNATRRDQEARESAAISKICASINQIIEIHIAAGIQQKKPEVEQNQRELISFIRNDDAVALGWIRKAANSGDPESQLCLGAMYSDGLGISKNPGEAMRWIRKAADQSNARALLVLSLAHYQGNGVSKDESEGFRLVQKATDLGDPIALIAMAGFYYKGVGVTKDESEARRLLRKVAEQNNAFAKSIAKTVLDKIDNK